MPPASVATRPAEPGLWRAGDRGTVRLALVLLGLFAIYLLLYVRITLGRDEPFRFGDFFALWSYPLIAHARSVATLYDFPALKAAQVALGMAPGVNNPYPYPPWFVLFLWPLRTLGYNAAYAVWISSTFLAYLAANRVRGAPWVTLAAALVPTSTINIVAGQGGFLTGALLVGGLRLMDRAPVAAGLLFGLLTYKPQFGLMVPVALLATRNWRCLAAAVAATALLALGTTLLLGAGIWGDWLAALPAYNTWFDTLTVRYLMPTVTANLELLGLPATLVHATQAIISLGAVGLTWLAFRRLPRTPAIAVLLTATCLATPHAFVYDLPMLSSAVLLVVAERFGRNDGFSWSEIAVLILVLVFPALMAFGLRGPFSTISLLLFAALLATAPRPPTLPA